ncbi:tyrosine-type recombinase/integrase [Sphingomonas naphthae]|uniref:Tyrosine-type recombinase/integrase n=1 Tax=Sphingomonas naphthae TaxID=1813468 RepID=A0ABY7TLH6_9SPHN|nr:tyrosine-type recombinase/integrase [Sphingomonas naphthae]WCT73800.1 tyrosine-type recombinase/integrase [Sphingomonas naphthae]
MKRKRRYPNVSSFTDRHGKLRWRWRKAGFVTYYFRSPPDTAGFKEELAACEAGAPIRAGGGRCIPRSVSDLVARYYASANFNRGGLDDQHRRRLLIESFRTPLANDLVANFRWDHIEAILADRAKKAIDGRGRVVGGPVAALNLRKQLRRLFAYAKRLGWITDNPVDDAERIAAPKTGGYYAWSEDDIAAYQARHPLGTGARLALEIMLWTGQRRSDARQLGPEHLKSGQINYRQGKTGTDLWLPAVPQLMEAIRAMQRVGLNTFLVTDHGKPFSRAGFGNKMREWCDEAGLPQCTSHGLRKAVARRLAESDASQQSIKAVGGWKGDAEVTIYTASADQKRLARTAIDRLSDADLANRDIKLAKSFNQKIEKKD